MTTTLTAPLTTVDADALRVEGEGDSRWYRYPPTGKLLTSVTTITGGTKSMPWGPAWGSKVTAVLAGRNLRELLALAEETEATVLADLTAEAGALLDAEAIAVQARAAGERAVITRLSKDSTRARDLKRDVGSYVHDVVKALILWQASGGSGASIAIPALPERLAGAYYDEDDRVEDVAGWMVDGFLNWVADFKPRILASEMVVFNPDLGIAGTLDAIAALDGRAMDPAGNLAAALGACWTSCVDVKTGKHVDETFPEQCTAYRRCPECMYGQLGEIGPMPHTDGSGVLHLRPEYPKGYRFMPVSRGDDAQAWNRFRGALRLTGDRAAAPKKPGRPAYPLLPDGTVPPRLLADLDGEGYGRAPGALDKAGVRDLDALAALDEAACLGLKNLGPKTIPLIRQILTAHGMCLAGEEPAGTVPAEPTGKVA